MLRVWNHQEVSEWERRGKAGKKGEGGEGGRRDKMERVDEGGRVVLQDHRGNVQDVQWVHLTSDFTYNVSGCVNITNCV